MCPDSKVEKNLTRQKTSLRDSQIDRTKDEQHQMGETLSRAQTYVDWLSYGQTAKLIESK